MLRFTVDIVFEMFELRLPMLLVGLILVPLLQLGWVLQSLDPLSEDPL